MNVLLYSLNYKPELTGIGKYNCEMVERLGKKGCTVNVLCAPPYYPNWKIGDGYKSTSFSTEYSSAETIFRCPIFIPKKVSTLTRLIHLFSFSISSGMKLISLLRVKYDIVLLVQPTLFCVPATLLYCKLTGARPIMHIQDYELDAMLGLGMGGGKLARYLKKAERWFLSKFYAVSTISFSMMKTAKLKGVEPSKIIFFPNWADLSFISPFTPYKDFKRNLGLKPATKVILYAGNLGKKQGLDIVIEAAHVLRNKKDIKFLLVGAGAHLEELKQKAHQLQITNLLFLPLQDWSNVPAMLAMADLHLVIQKKGAADSVLPSKLTNILAVGGHAIVTAEQRSELGQLHENHPGIYNLIEPESVSELVLAIKSGLHLKEKGFNVVARNYAEQYLSKDKIIDRFLIDVQEKLK